MLKTCMLAILASFAVAQVVTEITLPGMRVFPESLTSTADGTLYAGSLGHGDVLRIAPGKTTAEEWIKPGTGGLSEVYGVFADEKNRLFWVCSNNIGSNGNAAAVMSFDLKTGAVKDTYRLPGPTPQCNDIAVASDGTAYITDTRQNSVLMLRPAGKALELAAKDSILVGVDGLAFGDRTSLYVTSSTTGKLLRLNLEPDGKSTKIQELKPSRPLNRPAGMRAMGNQRLLLAENSGKMSVVTFEGPGLLNAVIKTLKEGIAGPSGVTGMKGMAWIAEGKLNYRNDPALKDKNPGSFKLYAVPLP